MREFRVKEFRVSVCGASPKTRSSLAHWHPTVPLVSGFGGFPKNGDVLLGGVPRIIRIMVIILGSELGSPCF